MRTSKSARVNAYMAPCHGVLTGDLVLCTIIMLVALISIHFTPAVDDFKWWAMLLLTRANTTTLDSRPEHALTHDLKVDICHYTPHLSFFLISLAAGVSSTHVSTR